MTTYKTKDYEGITRVYRANDSLLLTTYCFSLKLFR